MLISTCPNTIMVWLAAQPVFNISKSRPNIARRELHALIVYFGLTTQTIINLSYVISVPFDWLIIFYCSQIQGISEKLGFENDLTKAIRDSVLLKFGFWLALEGEREPKKVQSIFSRFLLLND